MSDNHDSLYALVVASSDLIKYLTESGGELSPEMEQALANVETKLPIKIDAYVHFLERMEMEEDYWKEKAKQYQDIAKGCANARERLKDALKAAAIAIDTDELMGLDHRFKISKTKPSLTIDQLKLSDDYLKQTVIFEPDKEKIGADLRAGIEVEGAIFKESVSIRSYVNSKKDKR